MKTLKLVSISFSFLALAALSGCAHHHQEKKTCTTEYELVPPTSYEGKMCVMRCGKERRQCRDNKELQYKNCQHYNRMAGMEFERCLASGATNCYSASAPPCERPCESTGACADECQAEYRFCFESCGGTVTSKQVCSDEEEEDSCDSGNICD